MQGDCSSKENWLVMAVDANIDLKEKNNHMKLKGKQIKHLKNYKKDETFFTTYYSA
jgi:hypothetical protein